MSGCHVLETEKILVFHRKLYQKKRKHLLTSGFVSNFVCFREIFADFDFDESYNYKQHVIYLCHILITRFC